MPSLVQGLASSPLALADPVDQGEFAEMRLGFSMRLRFIDLRRTMQDDEVTFRMPLCRPARNALHRLLGRPLEQLCRPRLIAWSRLIGPGQIEK